MVGCSPVGRIERKVESAHAPPSRRKALRARSTSAKCSSSGRGRAGAAASSRRRRRGLRRPRAQSSVRGCEGDQRVRRAIRRTRATSRRSRRGDGELGVSVLDDLHDFRVEPFEEFIRIRLSLDPAREKILPLKLSSRREARSKCAYGIAKTPLRKAKLNEVKPDSSNPPCIFIGCPFFRHGLVAVSGISECSPRQRRRRRARPICVSSPIHDR